MGSFKALRIILLGASTGIAQLKAQEEDAG